MRVLVGRGEERQALGKMASLLWCWKPEEQEVVYVRFFFFFLFRMYQLIKQHGYFEKVVNCVIWSRI